MVKNSVERETCVWMQPLLFPSLVTLDIPSLSPSALTYKMDMIKMCVYVYVFTKYAH